MDQDPRKGIKDEDINDLISAHKYRLSLAPPRQSSFRVVAIVYYELRDDQQQQKQEKDSLITPAETESSSSSPKERHFVVGTNDEPCTISGSICAERAALLQLRFVPKLSKVTKVVIVTDSTQPISPGMLCREFMSSNEAIDIDAMPIVLGSSVCINCGLDLSGGARDEKSLVDLEGCCSSKCEKQQKQKRHDFRRIRTTLAELYPYPSPYVRLSAKEAEEVGSAYAAQTQNSSQVEEHLKMILSSARGHDVSAEEELDRDLHGGLYRDGKEHSCSLESISRFSGEVVLRTDTGHIGGHDRSKMCYLSREDAAKYLLYKAKEASDEDSRSALHPLRYGAAVLFSDGTTAVSYQKKALEYGCSLDAVGQLAHVIEEKGGQYGGGARPVLLVQADQFGVLHAPFAAGRAYLSEHGYGGCEVAIHTNTADSLKEGELAEISLVKVSDLSPSAPDIWDDKA